MYVFVREKEEKERNEIIMPENSNWRGGLSTFDLIKIG
jgi:hypothetical protein